ncbi:MAG: phenylalanine--tRNA ligase subunit beta, partial [Balneolaceae bacterium]
SKALTLQTDSSYRFERGIDPTLQLRAAKRAADLIAELSGGKVVAQQTDEHPVKTDQKTVSLRPSRVNHLLGTDLGKEEISGILTRLEFGVTSKSEDELTCIVPYFRPDVSREVDLIEEVGRVFDYNNIPTPKTSPFFTPETLSDWEVFNERVRTLAKSLSYKEITTNSLLSKKEASLLADENLHIDTLNPVSQENTTLRTHLLAGFLKAARYNFNRNAKQLRFFELGHVFQQDKKGTWIDGVKEHSNLLFGLSGYKKFESWDGKPEPFSIFDLKADVEAFFRELNVHDKVEQVVQSNYELEYQLDGNSVAIIKMIDDSTLKGFDLEEDAFTAEIDITALYNQGLADSDTDYQKVSKYPSFEFDAAFIVDSEVRAGDLSKEIRRSADETLVSVDVFDVYEGKNLGSNKKSIAFRLSFLDSNKTLTIKDVEPMVKKIVQALESKFEAKLRS